MRLTLRLALIIAVIFTLLAVFLYFGRQPAEVYSGDLKDGLPHGYGTWKHSGGAYYTGEFYEGAWQGYGTWIHPDGIKYVGEWLQGEYHGRGTLILPSGARYDGYWFKGKKEGHGIYRWPDGTTYTGYWVNDRHEGYGVYKSPEGFSYEGDWLDGRKHGEGSAVYPDGSKYFGQWLNNKRHGRGTMFFADGSIYEGGYSEDNKHGEGTMTYPDGTVRTAKWLKGRLQEVAVETISIEPGNVSLVAGGPPAALVTTILPPEATNQEVVWVSSNPTVATVSGGLVSPLRPGSATITATTADGGYTAVCTVTVSTTAVSVTGVSLDRTSITIRVGETATLIAAITPSNATNQTLSWTSNNSAIAAVYQEGSRSGVVRAFAPGEAWVTVTSLDGQNTARCQVTVLPKEDPTIKVIVPRLIGKTLSEAKSLITENDLVVGLISGEYDDSVPIDQVIDQRPAVGTFVNKGSSISLTVSKGPAPEPDPEPDPEPKPEPEPDQPAANVDQ